MLSTKLKEAAGNGADATLYVDDVFSTYLYTGNGSTQTITNGIDLAGKGGLVWCKCRTDAYNNQLVNTVNGGDKYLISNLTTQQITTSLLSFNSNGYSINNAAAAWNSPTDTYVNWTFRKAAKFFDVQTVTHTNGTANNIDLSVLGTVGMVIAKITTTTGDWTVWQRGLTAGNNLQLNLTNAQSTTNAWLSVSGTTATLAAAAPTGTYVIYAYAHDTSSTGIIQCGTVTTDASGNATVNLGWEPQYVLLKRTNSSSFGNWLVFDSMRGWTNGGNTAVLNPNLSDAESTTNGTSPNATGFTVGLQASSTYIYMAIRRPNKPPTSGTQVYSPIATTSATGTKLTTDFVVDAQIFAGRNIAGHNTVDMSRLIGVSTNATESGNNLSTNTTDAEAANNFSLAWDNTGFKICSGFGGGNVIYWNFKRAPGFFDVVCYTGTASSPLNITHNLTVVPELIIIKSRSNVVSWPVYVAPLGNTKSLLLDDAGGQLGSFWNNTTPTTTQFTVGTGTGVNGSGYTYVAYLFATLAGISKVGSYTGNGSSQNIECGFAAGARFVLIKRTNSTGDWYVWDTARGIVAANDPHLSLNTTAAEVTTDDSVDPYSAGFAVNQVAATNINVSSATYIFLAIA